MKVTIIIGLPRSGKSCYARNNYRHFKIFDDVSNKLDVANQDYDFVIVDQSMCLSAPRANCEEYLTELYPDIEIKYICFENNPEQCILNARRRLKEDPNKLVEASIKYISRYYTYPENSTIIPVWKEPDVINS